MDRCYGRSWRSAHRRATPRSAGPLPEESTPGCSKQHQQSSRLLVSSRSSLRGTQYPRKRPSASERRIWSGGLASLLETVCLERDVPLDQPARQPRHERRQHAAELNRQRHAAAAVDRVYPVAPDCGQAKAPRRPVEATPGFQFRHHPVSWKELRLMNPGAAPDRRAVRCSSRLTLFMDGVQSGQRSMSLTSAQTRSGEAAL